MRMALEMLRMAAAATSLVLLSLFCVALIAVHPIVFTVREIRAFDQKRRRHDERDGDDAALRLRLAKMGFVPGMRLPHAGGRHRCSSR